MTEVNIIKINYIIICLKKCFRIQRVHLEPRNKNMPGGGYGFPSSNAQNREILNRKLESLS